MTPEQRLHIRAELARRMGWTGLHWHEQCLSPQWWGLRPGETGQINRPIPDPFTSAADNRALVAWICSDKCPGYFNDEIFLSEISKIYGQLKTPHSKRELACAMWDTLTAPREIITLAAARALGIPEASE